jgi:hypothetical protein
MFIISDLVSHLKNNEFFDDITGDNWKEFLESVKTSGVIEPIVITQDKIIVSGHQRVRACKELNITEVPCRIKIYEDGEKWSKDDLIVKELLETNLRQRGIGNLNPVKFARCIVELERLYGIREGRPGKLPNNTVVKSQKDLANEIGISVDQLQNYKKLLTLIPELQELVDGNKIISGNKDGKLSATIAYKVWAKLSPQDQQKLFEEIGKDKITKLTQKETQKYIDEINKIKQEKQKLEEELEEEKNKEPEAIVDPELEEKIKNLETEKQELRNKIKKLEGDNKQTTQEYKNIKTKYTEVINEKTKLEEQIIPLREKFKKEEYFLGFKTNIKVFVDSNAFLTYKKEELQNLSIEERKQWKEQIELGKSLLGSIEQYINIGGI